MNPEQARNLIRGGIEYLMDEDGYDEETMRDFLDDILEGMRDD